MTRYIFNHSILTVIIVTQSSEKKRKKVTLDHTCIILRPLRDYSYTDLSQTVHIGCGCSTRFCKVVRSSEGERRRVSITCEVWISSSNRTRDGLCPLTVSFLRDHTGNSSFSCIKVLSVVYSYPLPLLYHRDPRTVSP